MQTWYRCAAQLECDKRCRWVAEQHEKTAHGDNLRTPHGLDNPRHLETASRSASSRSEPYGKYRSCSDVSWLRARTLSSRSTLLLHAASWGGAFEPSLRFQGESLKESIPLDTERQVS